MRSLLRFETGYASAHAREGLQLISTMLGS
jgi:hypothetical protein